MPTLTELLARVRQVADIEDDGVFMPNTELTTHINSACYALDELLHATWEDYFTKTITTTFTGQSAILPADFYKLVTLDIRPTATAPWVEVRPYALKQRNAYRNSTDTRPEATRYRLEGSTLRFLPGYVSSVQASVTYYPKMPALVAGSDVRDYPNGWEQWAVLRAAIFALTKEDRTTTGLENLWALEDARVRASAPMREEFPVTFTNADATSTGTTGPGDGFNSW